MNTQSNAQNILTGACMALAASVQAASQSVAGLIEGLKSNNPEIRGEAWQKAGPIGAPAIAPLAELMDDRDFELARSAKRAAWEIVHYAGRPNAGEEAKAVEKALLPILEHPQAAVRREILWMLSEIGGRDSVEPMARLLGDQEVNEDARCALQRIPGPQAIQALRAAMGTAPEAFRYHLAESLRKRGETVAGYPTQKLVPAKPTEVQS